MGPTIAGVAVLILLVLAFLLYRRRRSKRASSWAEGQIVPYSSDITPQMQEAANGPSFAGSFREKATQLHQQQQPNSSSSGQGSRAGTSGTQSSRATTPNPGLPPPPPPPSLPQQSQTQTSTSYSSTQTPPQAQAPQVDVNRIIELIAARIDRPGPVPGAPPVGMMSDDVSPPPQYPHSPSPAQPPAPQAETGEPPRYRKRPPAP